jgi:hypothetical protein
MENENRLGELRTRKANNNPKATANQATTKSRGWQLKLASQRTLRLVMGLC